jgi:hypothetical protein
MELGLIDTENMINNCRILRVLGYYFSAFSQNFKKEGWASWTEERSKLLNTSQH